MADRFDNRVNHHRPDKDQPTVRKVPADSVPFGDSISSNGETVWTAYDSRGTLIAVAATSAEVRRKYCERKRFGVKNVAEHFQKARRNSFLYIEINYRFLVDLQRRGRGRVKSW